jgi:phospholipase C
MLGNPPPRNAVDRAGLSRRALLKGAGLLGAGAALSPRLGRLFDRLLAETERASPSGSTASLSDVERVVVLMQENRSFDHYFGRMSGVAGFDDRTPYRSYRGGPTTDPQTVFRQAGYTVGTGSSAEPYLEPFPLRSRPPTVDGQTTNDITHDWAPQHLSWDDGRMDQFVYQHVDGPYRDGTATTASGEKVPNGILTMGHFGPHALAFYYALADAFTICDHYHCSVLGPTDPNRLMWMSASIGADGREGGPVVETYVENRVQQFGTLRWKTMPEALAEAGVSWKVYQDPSSNAVFNVLDYFEQYVEPKTRGQAELAARGLAPVYPAEFAADVVAGRLPQVSFVLPPLPCCEHPATPPEYGEYLVSQILGILLKNPDVWAGTVFIVCYDENGGFFDHVSPPTPGPQVTRPSEIPTGDEYTGEYLTARSVPSAAEGILGPVGLGFRVPCLIVSPFSRGGYLYSGTLDHTSILRFLEARFGAEVPNLSAWRRSVTGDFTDALAAIVLRRKPDPSVPELPPTSLLFPKVAEQALLNSLAGTADEGLGYPPPTRNQMPRQQRAPRRKPLP